MPEANRKYVKQHLTRALNHYDDIQNYFVAVGMAFADKGLEISEDQGAWPEQYVNVIHTIDVLVTGLTELRNLTQQLIDYI